MTETAGPARALPAQFGPKPGWLRRAEINRQVEALVHRFTMRMGGLDVALAHGMLAEQVRLDGALVMMLASPVVAARGQAAVLIGAHLLDIGEKADPSFWETDLGRAIAREIGHVDIHPSKHIARSVLHVSRQAVDQMIQRGELEGYPGGPSVTRDSLQRAAARRWPFDSDV